MIPLFSKKKKHKSQKQTQSYRNNNENKEKDGNLSKKMSFTTVYPNNDGNGDVDEEDDAHDDMNDDDNDEDDARGSSVDNETEVEEEEDDQTSSNAAGGIGDQENNLSDVSSANTTAVRPSKDLKLPSLQTLDDLMYHDDLDEEKAYEDLCYVTFKSEVNNEILSFTSMFCSILMLKL